MSVDVALPPRPRRVLATALLLIPLALVAFIAAPALSSYQDHRDQLAALTRNVLAYQTAIAGTPAEQAALARLKHSPALNELVLPAQEASTAVAQLQEQIGQIAARAGARLIQTNSQVVAPDGNLIELSAHVVIEGDITTVRRVLHELETARPLLMIRRCTIRDPDGEWQRAPPPQPAGANLLQAELDISGFMRPS